MCQCFFFWCVVLNRKITACSTLCNLRIVRLTSTTVCLPCMLRAPFYYPFTAWRFACSPKRSSILIVPTPIQVRTCTVARLTISAAFVFWFCQSSDFRTPKLSRRVAHHNEVSSAFRVVGPVAHLLFFVAKYYVLHVYHDETSFFSLGNFDKLEA